MKKHFLYLGPLAALAVSLLMLAYSWSPAAAVTAGVTLLCACWWVSEALPIPVTSLLPLAVFPLAGVLSPNQIAEAYGSPFILLLMGGFILSTAMERSGAHRQIALAMVNVFGASSPKHIVFGFMAAAATLSMWISNTATTLMLLPIALAVVQYSGDKKLAVALMLGIAYAASVGGIGTPIGTPPNLIFIKVYSESTGTEITFLQWMRWAVPLVIVFVPLMALWLTRDLSKVSSIEVPSREAWSGEQKRVLLVFALTAFMWITRKEPFGGWSEWFDVAYANDASVALLAVVLMFIVPNGKGGQLLDWPTANRIPWGILFLFAGGLAIAKAFSSSGLAEALAAQLTFLTLLPVLVMMVVICIVVTFLTEITSNTATTALLMPILAIGGTAAGVDPALLMLPAAMSASCAFMLPVATAPNAIVFGSGQVTIQQMVRKGFVLNVIGVVCVSVLCFFLLA